MTIADGAQRTLGRRLLYLLPVVVVSAALLGLLTSDSHQANVGATSGPHANVGATSEPHANVGATSGPQVTVQLGPGATAAQIEAVIKDNSVDTLELLPGTYTPGRQVYVNVDRTRHLLIHPKTPGTVVFENGDGPAFYIGFGSDGGWPANARGGNVTIDDLIFDGYHMGPDGIIWTGNCHDITLTHITVRNSTGQGDTSWALYVSTSGGRGTTNLVANYWNVDGGNRTLGAMQSYHNPNADGIVLHHWTVKNAVYAIYAQSDATGLDIDDWDIDSSGYSTGSGSLSVVIWNVSGVIKNVHATNSGAPSIRSPMVDGGGNSWH